PDLTVAVLAATGFAARAGNAWLRDQWTELDLLMMRASGSRGRQPSENAFIGFSPQAPLGSLQLLKLSVSNEVALRVVSERVPGYLRGAVFDRFTGASWESQIDWQPVLIPRDPLPRHLASSFRMTGSARPERSLFVLRPFDSGEHRPMTIWRESVVDQFMFLPLSAKAVD